MISRRRFLAAGAAIRFAWPELAATSASPAGLRLEYEASSPPKVPPPLELDSPHRLVVEIGATAEGTRCGLGLRVALDGEPCLLPLAVWIGDQLGYWRHREVLRLPTFLGQVERDGDRWSLAVDGRTAYSVRLGSPPDEPAPAQPGLPWVTYRHSIHADWKQGPLDGPAELWELPAVDSSGPNGLPLEAVETAGSLDGWLTRLGASGPVAVRTVGAVSGANIPAGRLAREIDAASFEPFSLRNYPGGSPGVGPSDTSYLNPADLEAYRDRREIRLSGVMVVAVDASVARASVEPLLPPPCVALDTAVVRAMAIRGLDNPGLDEAWLFAQCLLEGKRVWYAVSHVRGTIAGSEFGREVLGYPTTKGSVTATLGASQFSSSISRDGSSLYHAAGFYGGFSTGTSLADMPVAALRLRHGAEPGGELVTQPWYYQGLRKPVRRESLYASFPAAEGDARASAWNRMGPANAYWAMVFDSATMQRLPGTVVAEVENPGPYYRDRCDGRVPWENPATGREQDPSD